jgi:hypothetical protein
MRVLKPVPFGLVAIAVVMIFAAAATDVYWLAKLLGRPFPRTLTVDPFVTDAFVVPDVVLSVLLYAGACGLILRKMSGFVISWVAMGMWIFDALLVLRLTRFAEIRFVGPSLAFAVFSAIYLWRKSRIAL